eukprot:CAMPEP_0117538430 /NCGR_PEP_ID=MMETSP0784-20121206/42475_1 /TAXON_ID=39447 /ORGANISM="" /LENGTH=227 /DNA_ID=CAMNT_0005335045 /DNA_START=475 /DNA_END=1158 /DNA_ORIENTATION=-
MGADSVQLKVLSEEQMRWDKILASIKVRASKKAQKSVEELWDMAQKVKYFKERFGPNIHMMYVRHLVYAEALRKESELPFQYSEFLYLREDSVFVTANYNRPTTVALLVTQKPTVIVDSWCGWGYYSDKTYITNRPGADILFGKIVETVTENLAEWLARSFERHEMFSTELWFSDMFERHDVDVQKRDFGRQEMRYHDGADDGPCVPALYWDCANPSLHTAMKQCSG